MSEGGKKFVLLLVIAALLCGPLIVGQGGGCNLTGNPSPIPDAGLRVLITYTDATRDALPPGQDAILASPTLRNWLDAHCTKDADGDPEWRIEPDSVTFTAAEPIWQKLMAVPRQSSPWLVVADGRRGVSQPLPADEPALMTVLTPFGGGK